MKCLRELKELADGISSCSLVDEQNPLIIAFSVQKLSKNYDTNSSEYIQAMKKLVQRCGDTKIVVAAFTAEMEMFWATARKLSSNF